MKQETLEEASLLSRPIHLIWDEDERYDCNEEFREEFKKGAKWQQERSYSEEEVLPLLEILQKCKEYFLLKTDKYSDERADAIIDAMEQFKKK